MNELLPNNLGHYKALYLENLSDSHTPEDVSIIDSLLSLLPLDSKDIQQIRLKHLEYTDISKKQIFGNFFSYIENSL